LQSIQLAHASAHEPVPRLGSAVSVDDADETPPAVLERALSVSNLLKRCDTRH
jgi:hypothetical protein